MKRVHIVGCAKTGTTLLQRLFCAFKDCHVVSGEIPYNKAIRPMKSLMDNSLVVTKRDCRTALSNDMSDEEVVRQLKLFKENGVQLIVTTRDRDDCLNAKSGSPGATRYDACARQQLKYSNHILYTVEYERLVSTPDEVQEEISRLLGIEINNKFSEYPDFVPSSFFVDSWGKSYRARKIGEQP